MSSSLTFSNNNLLRNGVLISFPHLPLSIADKQLKGKVCSKSKFKMSVNKNIWCLKL